MNFLKVTLVALACCFFTGLYAEKNISVNFQMIKDKTGTLCGECNGKKYVPNPDYDHKKIGSLRQIKCTGCSGKGRVFTDQKQYYVVAGDEKLLIPLSAVVEYDDMSRAYRIYPPYNTYGSFVLCCAYPVIYVYDKGNVSFWLNVLFTSDWWFSLQTVRIRTLNDKDVIVRANDLKRNTITGNTNVYCRESFTAPLPPELLNDAPMKLRFVGKDSVQDSEVHDIKAYKELLMFAGKLSELTAK